jgi:hypothetical protein
MCACVSKRFRTCRLERELQMVQLSSILCSRIAILWVSLVSFAVITLCVASQRVFIVVSVYFVIDSVRKFLDTPSYDPGIPLHTHTHILAPTSEPTPVRFSSPPRPDRPWGLTSLLIQWAPGEISPRSEADHSPPSSAEVKECVELYFHSPYTSPWRGASLSTGTILHLPYFYRPSSVNSYFLWRYVSSYFHHNVTPDV